MSETDFKKVNLIFAAIVLIAVLACYIFTISPTVSFWDSGEFIATSYILGVPHPPGTPFYVIVGRLFSMIPFVKPALGVNLMSAVSGALAALFLYLITVDLLVMWRGVPRNSYEKIVVISSGASSAFAGAFGGSCWTNSIEAEVYAPSCFVMAFTTWLVLQWSKAWKEEGARNRLVLIVYLVSLCVGLHLGTLLVLPAFIIFAALVDPDLFLDWRFFVAVVFVGLLGLSNHLYLPIRSYLNPAIDEANPEKWQAFKDCLLRKQYKPMNPFIRNASWSFQFGMFWRYFYEQWTNPRFPWTSLLILFGAIGAIVHFFKHRKTFVLMGVLFLLLSLGLIIYMNFTDHEVRERDYFFAHGFFFFCAWIGIGFAYLSDLVKSSKNWASFAPLVPIVLLIFAASTFLVNFETHDRRGEYNAYDYAYNLLATVDRDGLLFTNGDNDTFPLWFIQEVEGFRKDVRVVNLSLLNTSWYIWQLKHLEPKVPMRFTDRQIEDLRPRRGSDGKILLVKDIAAKEIIDCAGNRPVYFAVTVADYMGYDPRLKLEGLAFRLVPEAGRDQVDVERTLHNLYNVYSYRGLLKPKYGKAPEPRLDYLPGPPLEPDLTKEMVYDKDVYKDDTILRLVSNYSAAHLRLAIRFFEAGDYEKAIRELERSRFVSPDYSGYRDLAIVIYGYAGHIDIAESLATVFARKDPRNPTPYIQLYRVYQKAGRDGDAERTLLNLIENQPDNPEGYSYLASFYKVRGEPEKAANVIRRWVNRYPDDHAALKLLQELEREAAQTKGAR